MGEEFSEQNFFHKSKPKEKSKFRINQKRMQKKVILEQNGVKFGTRGWYFNITRGTFGFVPFKSFGVMRCTYTFFS